ncbi:MAG TPA: PASTA domain-containing protein [Chloroflexia bacterium]|nr:PASTA domain-containing protein [Chloroflexia bacterium]
MQSETTELPIEGRYTLTGRVNTYDLGPVELHNATDRQLERQVAMQLLPATAPEEEKAAFLERQRVAAGIHHCGVVQVYDVGEWHGAHFSVIEKEALSRGAPAPAPDAETALSTARQVAEALQCVRDAGLESWVFTPAALRTGADGAPRLALLEGLEHDVRYRTAMSSRREDDGRALGALLGMLIAGLPLGAVPAGVHDLIDVPPLSAGEFAAEIAQVELAAQQRTQAYAEAHDNAATPYLAAGTLDSHDAPTLAAPVVASAAAAPAAALAQPYRGPAAVETGRIAPPREASRRAGVPLLPVAAAAVLLLGLLLFVAWPRATGPGEVAGSAAFASDSTRTPSPEAAPTAAPTAPPLLAPELVGKPLAEAKEIALASGLGLIVSAAAHSDQYPVDVVMSQDLAPGTPVASGSDISIVVSLGPEPPPPPPAGDDDDDDDNKNDKKNNGRGKKKP